MSIVSRSRPRRASASTIALSTVSSPYRNRAIQRNSLPFKLVGWLLRKDAITLRTAAPALTNGSIAITALISAFASASAKIAVVAP